MTSPNSMTYWWPITSGLGIPVPRTVMVAIEPPTDGEVLLYTCVAHQPADVQPDNPECRPMISVYADRMIAAGREIGYPLFLRTDQISGKHSWEGTCYVPDEATVRRHIHAVVEAHALALFMAGPEAEVAALAFREFLDLDAPFTTFRGMPVARERRYFVEGGAVVCKHPYWGSPLPRVARVVESPALVEQFITECKRLGWDCFEASEPDVPPSIARRSGFPFDIDGGGDVLLQRYHDLGLTPLQPQEGQHGARYLGAVLTRRVPMEQRFAVLSGRRLDAGRPPAEGLEQEIDGLTLDLLDADYSRVSGAPIPTPTHPWTLTPDEEAAVGVEDASAISDDYWIVFHEVPSPTVDDGMITVCALAPESRLGTDNIEDGFSYAPQRPPADWRELHAELNREPGDEVELLSGYARRVSAAIPGAWSVDFAYARDGTWYLIDMAEADRSWHPEHEGT